MIAFIARKIAFVTASLISVTVLMFVLIQLAPDDAASIMLRGSGILPSDAAVENLREELGIDQSLPVQYLAWLASLLQGNFGTSFSTGLPVTATLTPALGRTLQLAAMAFVLTVAVSLPLGILCAKRQNRAVDRIVRFVTYAYASIPTFVVGIVALYALCVRLKIFPTIANNHEGGLVVPTIVLASTSIAWMIRQVRTAFMEKMNEPYVLGLRARGVTAWRIDVFYVLKGSMNPIVTSLGICFGSMLGGAVLVESIFTWSGLGQTVLTAINARDYPMLMGFALYIAAVYLIINALIDVLYGVFDPRAKATSKSVSSLRRARLIARAERAERRGDNRAEAAREHDGGPAGTDVGEDAPRGSEEGGYKPANGCATEPGGKEAEDAR